MMNGVQSTSSGMEMSVVERQRAVLKGQHDHLQISQFPQQQQQQAYFSDFNILSLQSQQLQNFQGGLLVGAGDKEMNELLTTWPSKPDPGFKSGSGSVWPEYGPNSISTTNTTTMDQMLNCGISRTVSCPPAAATKESFRKRKADHKTLLPPKQAADESRAKKIKRNCDDDELVPKKADQNNTSKNSNSSSSNITTKNGNNERKEGCEDQKQDYIHVRARRGQATDSHSLAERVRREKISERMKYLQDLVPGCNKIIGKAGMLDEIINYIQSLQRQVEFLSVKLAGVNPTLDSNIEDLFAKEACSSNFPGSGIILEMGNLAYLQFSQGQQMGPVSASNLGMSEVEMELRRTISAPVSVPETFLDSSCLTQQIQTYLPWDQTDVQSINIMDFQQARQQSFPSQTYTGAD